MVLDALIKIKNEIDSTLTFRRSCREGICGSCAMNIDGKNGLACVSACADVKHDIKIYPLPHMPVIKDLIPTSRTSMPSTHRSSPGCRPARRHRPTASACRPRKIRKRSIGLRRAFCAPAVPPACPSYWWNSERYLGPRRCWRPIAGSSTAAMRRPASASIISKIRSACIAAIPS